MNESVSDGEEAETTTLTDQIHEKQQRVIKHLQDDILASDTKISLFVCALESYRYDSVLRPFPPLGLRDDGTKNVQKLTQICNSLPTLSTLVEGNSTLITDEGWQLLDWLLGKTFDIKTLDKSMFKEIENKTGQSSYSSTQPDFVFEVQYHTNNILNKRFLDLAKDYSILYAYHGSGPENFHSILHNGLHSHMNKNSLFGEGTYLSSDLNVSIPYSKYSHIWTNSALGEKMSCMAVCEVLDHPDVKCTLQNDTRDRSNGQTENTRARARNSEAGDVPERYYVVTNNQLLRVKYLLVYVEKHKTKRTSPGRWFARLLVLYIAVLIVLGLSRTRAFSNIHIKLFGPHTQM